MKNKSQGKKKAASRGGVQGLVKAVASNLSVKQQKRDLRRAEKAAAAADGSDTYPSSTRSGTFRVCSPNKCI